MAHFGKTSRTNLLTCHEDLQLLFNEVIKNYDCAVLCGYRTEDEQNKSFRNGRSSLMYPFSNHNTNPSNAVDVVPYPIKWEDKAEFYKFEAYVLNTAMKLNVRIKWGGFFYTKGKPFFDAPHFERIEV